MRNNNIEYPKNKVTKMTLLTFFFSTKQTELNLERLGIVTRSK